MKEVIRIDHLLNWVYQKQKADIIAGRGAGLEPAEASADGLFIQRASGDGCHRVAWNAELGSGVDGGGRDKGALHPDAEAIHDAVAMYQNGMASLVIRHAKAGTIPPTGAKLKARVGPVYNGKGEPKRIWSKSRKWIGCEVRIIQTQDSIDYLRNTHRQWLTAVNALVDYFNMFEDQLVRYKPAEISAEEASERLV